MERDADNNNTQVKADNPGAKKSNKTLQVKTHKASVPDVKNSSIENPGDSASKLTDNQAAGDMPEAQPNVEDNVSDKRDADLKTTVESNIKNSDAPANKDKETDSKIAIAQTDISKVNDNAGNELESQAKATNKPKISGNSSSKKWK